MTIMVLLRIFIISLTVSTVHTQLAELIRVRPINARPIPIRPGDVPLPALSGFDVNSGLLAAGGVAPTDFQTVGNFGAEHLPLLPPDGAQYEEVNEGFLHPQEAYHLY